MISDGEWKKEHAEIKALWSKVFEKNKARYGSYEIYFFAQSFHAEKIWAVYPREEASAYAAYHIVYGSTTERDLSPLMDFPAALSVRKYCQDILDGQYDQVFDAFMAGVRAEAKWKAEHAEITALWSQVCEKNSAKYSGFEIYYIAQSVHGEKLLSAYSKDEVLAHAGYHVLYGSTTDFEKSPLMDFPAALSVRKYCQDILDGQYDQVFDEHMVEVRAKNAHKRAIEDFNRACEQRDQRPNTFHLPPSAPAPEGLLQRAKKQFLKALQFRKG